MRGESLLVRFENKYSPEPNSGCWLWVGSIGGRDGRGNIWSRGKTDFAHRVSWELFRGEIPNGLQVLHTCDVPSCVNPDHLWLGTQDDNMKDCARKGRIICVGLRGSEVGGSVLTEGQVREIKTRQLSRQEYAKKFNIGPTYVNSIQRGRVWAHISVPESEIKPKRSQTQAQVAKAAYMRAYNLRKGIVRNPRMAGPAASFL